MRGRCRWVHIRNDRNMCSLLCRAPWNDWSEGRARRRDIGKRRNDRCMTTQTWHGHLSTWNKTCRELRDDRWDKWLWHRRTKWYDRSWPYSRPVYDGCWR